MDSQVSFAIERLVLTIHEMYYECIKHEIKGIKFPDEYLNIITFSNYFGY